MLALALLLAGCGRMPVEGMALSAPAQIGCGQTAETALSFLYKDAAAAPESETDALTKKFGVRYTVSDPTVLSVDEAGVLTALAPGSAEVTATSKDGKLTATQTVTTEIFPGEITLPAAFTLNLKTNPQAEIKAEVAPEDATATQVSYTTSDPNVAAVDENGMVRAVGEGTAILTATVPGCEVAVARSWVIRRFSHPA